MATTAIVFASVCLAVTIVFAPLAVVWGDATTFPLAMFAVTALIGTGAFAISYTVSSEHAQRQLDETRFGRNRGSGTQCPPYHTIGANGSCLSRSPKLVSDDDVFYLNAESYSQRPERTPLGAWTDPTCCMANNLPFDDVSPSCPRQDQLKCTVADAAAGGV